MKSFAGKPNTGKAYTGKTFVGPRLRQLRRDHGHTQADMASRLGVSAAYVNLMEHNQRSLSVRVLVGLLEAYGVDWQDLVNDVDNKSFDDLRAAIKDPIFGDMPVDPRELRAAIDNAPNLVAHFLKMHGEYRNLLENMMRIGNERMPDELLASSPETVIHDFFRNNSNYFPELEKAANQINKLLADESDVIFVSLKQRLAKKHNIKVAITAVEEMGETLRIYDDEEKVIRLSEGLDHINKVFQLAHVLCFVEYGDALEKIATRIPDQREAVIKRCQVELANYFAAALLMPYDAFLKMAKETRYDIDRMAARFEVSFEQVCHRLTTMNRAGDRGISFFFIRVDLAGNISKRLSAGKMQFANHGGTCGRWVVHQAFRVPSKIITQVAELEEGEQVFTMARTVSPLWSPPGQPESEFAVALGCNVADARDIVHADGLDLGKAAKPVPIGIGCHVCERMDCAQRSQPPLGHQVRFDPFTRKLGLFDLEF